MKTSKSYWRAGFTLLELLVVVVILGLIMAIATPQLMKVLEGAKQDAAKLQMKALGQSLDLYKLDVGAYPSTEQGLQALVENEAKSPVWSGPYVRASEQLIDPWGAIYIYEAQTTGYRLKTFGEDKISGGAGESADLSWPDL